MRGTKCLKLDTVRFCCWYSKFNSSSSSKFCISCLFSCTRFNSFLSSKFCVSSLFGCKLLESRKWEHGYQTSGSRLSHSYWSKLVTPHCLFVNIYTCRQMTNWKLKHGIGNIESVTTAYVQWMVWMDGAEMTTSLKLVDMMCEWFMSVDHLCQKHAFFLHMSPNPKWPVCTRDPKGSFGSWLF